MLSGVHELVVAPWEPHGGAFGKAVTSACHAAAARPLKYSLVLLRASSTENTRLNEFMEQAVLPGLSRADSFGLQLGDGEGDYYRCPLVVMQESIDSRHAQTPRCKWVGLVASAAVKGRLQAFESMNTELAARLGAAGLHIVEWQLNCIGLSWANAEGRRQPGDLPIPVIEREKDHIMGYAFDHGEPEDRASTAIGMIEGTYTVKEAGRRLRDWVNADRSPRCNTWFGSVRVSSVEPLRRLGADAPVELWQQGAHQLGSVETISLGSTLGDVSVAGSLRAVHGCSHSDVEKQLVDRRLRGELQGCWLGVRMGRWPLNAGTTERPVVWQLSTISTYGDAGGLIILHEFFPDGNKTVQFNARHAKKWMEPDRILPERRAQVLAAAFQTDGCGRISSTGNYRLTLLTTANPAMAVLVRDYAAAVMGRLLPGFTPALFVKTDQPRPMFHVDLHGKFLSGVFVYEVRDSIMADIDAGALPPWTMSYIKHAAQVPGAPEKGPWTRLEDGREVAPEALIFAPRRMRIEHMAVQSKACIIRGSMDNLAVQVELSGNRNIVVIRRLATQEVCAALGAPGVLPESPWWMVSTDAETILGYTGESSIRDVESPNFITGGSLDAPEQRAGWEFRHSVNETYKAVVPDSGARCELALLNVGVVLTRGSKTPPARTVPKLNSAHSNPAARAEVVEEMVATMKQDVAPVLKAVVDAGFAGELELGRVAPAEAEVLKLVRELHKLMGASPTTSLLSSQDYVTVAEFAARVFGDQARASQTFILMLLRNAAWYSVSWTEVTSGGKPKVALLTACLYTLHNIYRFSIEVQVPKRTKAGTTVHEANILGAVNVKKPKLDPALAVSTSLAAEGGGPSLAYGRLLVAGLAGTPDPGEMQRALALQGMQIYPPASQQEEYIDNAAAVMESEVGDELYARDPASGVCLGKVKVVGGTDILASNKFPDVPRLACEPIEVYGPHTSPLLSPSDMAAAATGTVVYRFSAVHGLLTPDAPKPDTSGAAAEAEEAEMHVGGGEAGLDVEGMWPAATPPGQQAQQVQQAQQEEQEGEWPQYSVEVQVALDAMGQYYRDGLEEAQRASSGDAALGAPSYVGSAGAAPAPAPALPAPSAAAAGSVGAPPPVPYASPPPLLLAAAPALPGGLPSSSGTPSSAQRLPLPPGMGPSVAEQPQGVFGSPLHVRQLAGAARAVDALGQAESVVLREILDSL